MRLIRFIMNGVLTFTTLATQRLIRSWVRKFSSVPLLSLGLVGDDILIVFIGLRILYVFALALLRRFRGVLRWLQLL